ncbi:cytosine permease [Corynebacterium sp. sy039]|nr:cytosine permease [Corynebacterium sp. sy039]
MVSMGLREKTMYIKGLETRSIEFIPESERRGHPAEQFPLWFSVNMMVLTTLTGSIGITIGLNVFWTSVGIILGNFIGALFVAGHAVQGPHLGIPQMIQSRAQFGYYGAVLPLIATLIMYIGYVASNQVIAGEAIADASGINIFFGIIFSGIIVLIITFYGFNLIQKTEKILAVLLGIGFVGVTIMALKKGLPENALSITDFNLSAFLSLIAATAAWQLTFAPYIADYTRYLPSNTSGKKLTFYTYSGLVVSTTWLMILGAILATEFRSYSSSPSKIIAGMFPESWASGVYVFVVLGVIATNVLNLYGAFMALTTIIDTFIKINNSLSLRLFLFLIVFISSMGIATLASGEFMIFFGNLLIVLGYLLFPWTSINLADYFFVRKGKYFIPDIYTPHGIYGAFNTKAISAYILTLLVELPFAKTDFFTGFIYERIGNTDYSWIIALVLPGLLYCAFMTVGKDKRSDAHSETKGGS